MNKTLAIHIEEDFLVAGVEPLNGKFHKLTKRGSEEFYFYFYVDKINNKIDYSKLYKEKVESEVEYYYGGFFKGLENATFSLNAYDNEYVELLNPIISDIREMYFVILRSLLSGEEIDELEEIPLKISYSTYLNKEAKYILERFFKRHSFDVLEAKSNFPLLVVKEFFHENSINSNNKKIAFVEAIGTDLNMSIVNIYNKFDSEITLSESFTNFGLDPRTFILAKKIVDDINKQEGLLGNEETVKKEYLRQLNLSKKLLEQLEKQTSPYLRVETNFAVETNRTKIINISIEELNQLTFSHVRQLARYFESYFLAQNNININDLDNIILLGDMLSNTAVKTEFARFGQKKIEYLESSKMYLSLRNLLHVEEAQENPSLVRPTENWEELEFLNIETLTIGQSILLSNFDSAPGKGESIQQFNYLGNNQFLVVRSTRSLQKGDLAEPLSDVWVPGMQTELKVFSNSKLRGVFTTRKIVKIEISD